jgi:ubiquinone/menaquinone biosynthesis C-methylase UbiE/drug/metabolite transporter (DMT)-like permease
MIRPKQSAVRSSGSGRWVPLLCLLGAGSMLGLSTDFAKLAPGAGLPPLAFLAWSLVGGTLVLALVGAVRGRLPSFGARTVEYFLVAGFLGLAAPNLIFFSAVPRVGASFVAVSLALSPLYTYAGTLLLRMERFDAWRALGVVLTLAGSLMLAVLKLSVPGVPTLWIVATLSAPVLLAAGNIYRTLRWPPGSGSDQLAPGMLGAAALVLLVVGALPGGFGAIPDLSLAVPTGDAAALFLIVAQAAAFAMLYLLFFVLQQRGGPVYLSLLGSVAAVVGSVIAIFLLGESAPQGLLVVGALIALGVGLVTLADAQPSIREARRQMLELAPVKANDRVLDVGCGIGLETARLVALAGEAGCVVGIDRNAAMVAEARRLSLGSGLNINYEVMDARGLGFTDGAFDLCRTERVLRYVERPERAIREMARVARPGGRVVAFDFDSDATVIDAPDPGLTRRMREVLDAAVTNCWIGRQLPRLFRQAGLEHVTVIPHVVTIPSLAAYRRLVDGTLEAAARSGVLSPGDLARWDGLAGYEREGGVLVVNLGFVVRGRRPQRLDKWNGDGES